jgi:16S rRNA (guanine1207-N2)-methyltransferase
VLAMAAASLPPGSPLWVVGERKGGIQSAHADLAQVADLYDEAAGRHARLLMSRARTRVASLDDYAHPWTLECAGNALEVVSFPGVFSHGRLDEGTRLLLETVPRLSGPLLDVGSGAGVIGAWYARESKGNVTLTDADALALEASRRTLAANGILGTVEPVDVLPREGAFASIVSNPPFHRGVSTDYEVIEALAIGAPARLSYGGTLTLVCNRFLGAAKPLDRAFGAHELLKDDGRYRVYRATKR